MKTVFSISSLVIGLIGLGVFFNPVYEIVCGVGGLILSLLAKSKETGKTIRFIRSWGNYLAWINIIWVIIEFGLKYAGIDLFQ